MLAGPLAGEAVIVTGAAGVVCNYAVQLAKIMGASVLAVVRGETEKEEDAQRAGADLVINSEKDNFLKQRSISPMVKAHAVSLTWTLALTCTSPHALPL